MIRIDRPSTRELATAFLCCFVQSCGGGGGGGGGGAGGAGAGPPPAPPSIAYSGVSTPADFSDTNAGAIADGMFAMTFVALDIAEDIQSPSAPTTGPVSYTVSGPQGGSATVVGVINADTTGWLQASFANYGVNGITYNGGEVVEISQALSGTTPQIGRISYYDLHAVGNNLNVDYVGTISRRILDALDTNWTVTGDVLIHDLLSQTEWYAQNINISRHNITGGRELTVQSRVSHSAYGYVDVATTAPWGFATDTTNPAYGGPLVGTGKDGRTLAVSSLTPQLGAVEYMSAPRAKPDRSARINWLTPANQQIRSSGAVTRPVTDPGAAAAVAPGTTVTLEGRYSYQPDGAFLSFNWRLLSRPPGSQASLDDANATRPAVTFDLPGDYLIELTTSDGTSQTTSAISIPVVTGYTTGSLTETAYLPADMQVTPGQGLILPVAFPITSSGSSLAGVTIEATAPDGSPENVGFDQPTLTFQYTPNGTGLHHVVLRYLNSPGGQIDDLWLAAGTDFHYLPTASVPRTLGAPELSHVATADLNGDGYTDVVLSTADYQLNAALEIFHGNAAGGLDAPVVMNEGSGGAIAVGDFNGDGRIDLAVATTAGFDVLLQQADGSLAAPQSYSVGCYTAFDQSILAAGDFNGDGRTDLAVTGCNHQVILYLQGSDGLMHAGTSVAIPASIAGPSAVADLNGDGVVDLAIAFTTGNPGNIVIIPGDRTLGLGTPYSMSENFLAAFNGGPVLAVGDINGDGRADLVFSVDDNNGNRGIHTYLQQADGTLKPGPSLTTSLVTTAIFIADLNGDGLQDIALAGGNGPGISLWYQSTGGIFTAPIPDNRFNGQPIGLLDVNRDQVLDVLALGGNAPSGSTLVIGYGIPPGGGPIQGIQGTARRTLRGQ